MPIYIPVAQARSGKLVVPSCSKEEAPFVCLECSRNLVLKQGKIKVSHFAHRHRSPGCSGIVEAALHKAAELLWLGADRHHCNRAPPHPKARRDW